MLFLLSLSCMNIKEIHFPGCLHFHPTLCPTKLFSRARRYYTFDVLAIHRAKLSVQKSSRALDFPDSHSCWYDSTRPGLHDVWSVSVCTSVLLPLWLTSSSCRRSTTHTSGCVSVIIRTSTRGLLKLTDAVYIPGTYVDRKRIIHASCSHSKKKEESHRLIPRPTLSQLWSFKIAHTTFLCCIIFALGSKIAKGPVGILSTAALSLSGAI